MSFESGFKQVPVKQLEEAIARTLSQLVEEKIVCSIDGIEFGTIGEATFTVKTRLFNEMLGDKE